MPRVAFLDGNKYDKYDRRALSRELLDLANDQKS